MDEVVVEHFSEISCVEFVCYNSIITSTNTFMSNLKPILLMINQRYGSIIQMDLRSIQIK